MRNILSRASLFGALFFAALANQNCAVYRNDDRKLIEDQGVPRVTASSLATSSISNDASLTSDDDEPCSISPVHLDILARREMVQTLPDPQTELDGGSFAFLSVSPRGYHISFVGARADKSAGVLCRFTFDSAESRARSLDVILAHSSKLVHELADSDQLN